MHTHILEVLRYTLPHPVKHFGDVLCENAAGESLFNFIIVTDSLFKALKVKNQKN